MKNYGPIALILTIFSLSCLFSCEKDITVPPPPIQRQDYTGTYTVIENYSQEQSNWIRVEQFVKVTFTDYRFFCQIDTLKETDIRLCDFSGSFITKTVLTLSDTVVTGQCRHEFIPFGDFNIIVMRHRGAPDSLQLTQEPIDQHDLFKEFILERVE